MTDPFESAPDEADRSEQQETENQPPLPDLDPAASASHGHRNSWVIGAGLMTTALALAGVYLLQEKSAVNVMGWYADFVIPIGALLVGLVASSGYGMAAWRGGFKIRRGLLVTIVILQIGAYFAAQYTEFAEKGPLFWRLTGQRLDFPHYFHLITMTIAWKDDKGGIGTPLGYLGYGLRALELVGFVLGTLIVPLALSKKAYCEPCERYMRSKLLTVLPASNVKAGHLFGKAARPMTDEEAFDAGAADMTELAALGTAGDVEGFRAKLAAAAPERKAAGKLRRRINIQDVIEIVLVSCPGCSAGHLDMQLAETRGRHVSLKHIAKTQLSQDFVRSLTP